jgi:hypothetical protein
MTLTYIILSVSLLANFALLIAWAATGAAARYWATSYREATYQYMELRRNSHRRDLRTGRLLPKGK